jgi:hypothetical protein
LKVSGNNTTGGAEGLTVARARHQSMNGSDAKRGTSRRGLIPAARLTAAPMPGMRGTALASRGARAARRAWSMISPIE